MGAGIHLPRALTAVAALLTAGCIDFVAPDLPQIGGPAIFQGSVRVEEDGAVHVAGALDPGLDADGFRRTVASEAVVALEDSIQPDQVATDGTRSYLETWITDPAIVAGPLTLEAPVVDGVDPPPAIRWGGIVRLDADTIALGAAEDLSLHTLIVGTDEPAPLNRSWNLVLRSGEDVLRIGANDGPPPVIDVPASWLPGGADRVITADLVYQRSHSAGQGSTSYVASFLTSVTLNWTIVRADGGSQQSGGGR